MITRAQQILLKRAQAQALLSDAEYRELLAQISGIEDLRSSTDRRMTDTLVDHFLAVVEVSYWRSVDAGLLPAPCKPDAVFRQRGYWTEKNRRGDTSRDRYTAQTQGGDIADLEAQLAKLGFGPGYCRAIQNKIIPFSPPKYAAALRRTLASKQKPTNQPY